MQPSSSLPGDPSLRVVGRPTAHDSPFATSPAPPSTSMTCASPRARCISRRAGHPRRADGPALDLDAVRKLPGVVAVLTAADIPGRNDVSPVMGDDPMLAADTIEFDGQVVFAVVAETRDIARRAARLGKVEVAAERPLVSVDDAFEADCHILPDYAFTKGDSAAALAASPRRLAGTLRIGGQEHFYLEGQVALAIPGEDDIWSTPRPSIRARCSTSWPPARPAQCRGHRRGAADGRRVRRQGEPGRAMGGARRACGAVTGRPCKFRLDRDDDMSITGKRHDFRADYDVGFDDDGRLTALDITLASRCGYSADLSGAINDRAMFHADNTYYLPAVNIVTRRMKTNTVSNTAFRGFGGPQGMMAIERVMDAIAVPGARSARRPQGQSLWPRPRRDALRHADQGQCRAADHRGAESADYAARREAVAAFNASLASCAASPLRRSSSASASPPPFSTRPAPWCWSITTDRSISIMAAPKWARA